MKVLFVCTRYYPNEVGGAEVTVRLLAEGLVQAGDEAVVVSLAPDGQSSVRLINGVHVYYLPLFNVFFPHEPRRRSAWQKVLWQIIEAWNPVMARRLTDITDAEKPDLVHLHNILGFSCAIWPALARRGMPILQTLHDHYSACSNSLMHRAGGGNCTQRCLRCRVLCAPRLRLSRHVDGLTTVSARLWSRIGPAGGFAGRRLTRVIHNCNGYPPSTSPRSGPRSGVPLRVGFLGRLEPIKGPQVLLDAAQRVGAERVHVYLGGNGTPDFVQALKSRFSPALATFLGHVSPAEFFMDIDLLVAPSLVEEASGRVVHEAFGFGVPAIGVSDGGMAELIEEGRTGYIVPAGDIDALEGRLRALLDDPPDWVDLSRACLQAARRFSFDHIFNQYRAAWEDVRLTAGAAGKARTPMITLVQPVKTEPFMTHE